MQQNRCENAGCTWDTGAGECGGTPAPCEQLEGNTCTTAECTRAVCAGTATACEELDEPACGARPGCTWG